MKINNVGRRNFLIATASGIGLSGVSTISGARSKDASENLERIIETSFKILKTSGPQAQKQFLINNGVVSTYKKKVSSVFGNKFGQYQSKRMENSTNSSKSSVTLQSAPPEYCVEPNTCDYEPDLEASLSIVSDPVVSDRYYVSLSSRYRYRYRAPIGHRGATMTFGPESPQDGCGLAWDPDSWSLPTSRPGDNIDTTSNVVWDNGSESGGDGIGFRIDSEQACLDSGITDNSPNDGVDQTEWTDWSYGMVELTTDAGHQVGDKIWGKYIYTWNDSSLSFGINAGVGLNGPNIGLAITGSSSVKTEDVGTNPDGYELVVTEP
ncbi:hypothetical protein U3A55_07380 [Salarchaeum sp. III]|uniref:hypothetical protein n=1 Tax=Salarchaeum sp. III TaxID=3107927 RepID=UPI002EDB0EF0